MYALPEGACFACSLRGLFTLWHNCEKRPLLRGGGVNCRFSACCAPCTFASFVLFSEARSASVRTGRRDRFGRTALGLLRPLRGSGFALGHTDLFATGEFRRGHSMGSRYLGGFGMAAPRRGRIGWGEASRRADAHQPHHQSARIDGRMRGRFTCTPLSCRAEGANVRTTCAVSMWFLSYC